MKELRILDLGLIDYEKAKKKQDELVEKRIKGSIQDTLILCEHKPVITIGRKGGVKDLLVPEEFLGSKKVRVHYIERGGEATYHGPGQLVGYPIMKLSDADADLHVFLRKIEEVIIRTLSGIGIRAARRKDLTGVWVSAPGGPEKIAFIGISARKWVTFHGFSLNISCGLEPFSWIIPCGIKEGKVTSVEKCSVASGQHTEARIKKIIIENFKKVFRMV